MDPKPRKSLRPILKKPSYRGRLSVWAGLLACLFLFENCTVGSGSSPQLYAQANPFNYFSSATQATVEVYYEAGAEPYTGTAPQGIPYWRILGENLESIFQYRSNAVTVNVPTTLAQMVNIPAQVKAAWTSEDILALHRRHFSQAPTTSHARFYIYFVRGYYSDNGVSQNNVLGVSLGGTPVIAIFKDVIQSGGLVPGSVVAKFVEQSTLVHEVGHALGFVNNGVPMASPHQDVAHGAHTTDPECVMYWQNESINNMTTFVQKYITATSVVMWGPKVLADAQNYSR